MAVTISVGTIWAVMANVMVSPVRRPLSAAQTGDKRSALKTKEPTAGLFAIGVGGTGPATALVAIVSSRAFGFKPSNGTLIMSSGGARTRTLVSAATNWFIVIVSLFSFSFHARLTAFGPRFCDRGIKLTSPCPKNPGKRSTTSSPA
eukprot:3267209-Rhodomonas_salina.1